MIYNSFLIHVSSGSLNGIRLLPFIDRDEINHHHRNGQWRRSVDAHSAANVDGHEAIAAGHVRHEGTTKFAEPKNGASGDGDGIQFLMAHKFIVLITSIRCQNFYTL